MAGYKESLKNLYVNPVRDIDIKSVNSTTQGHSILIWLNEDMSESRPLRLTFDEIKSIYEELSEIQVKHLITKE